MFVGISSTQESVRSRWALYRGMTPTTVVTALHRRSSLHSTASPDSVYTDQIPSSTTLTTRSVPPPPSLSLFLSSFSRLIHKIFMVYSK